MTATESNYFIRFISDFVIPVVVVVVVVVVVAAST